MSEIFVYSGRYTKAYNLRLSEVNEMLNTLIVPDRMALMSIVLTPHDGVFDVVLHFRSIKMLSAPLGLSRVQN